MGRKPAQVVTAEINRLRRILDNDLDKSDIDIMLELGIKSSTFYRYKQKIRQQDNDAWLEVAKESLESAALKVKKSLDFCIQISKDVATKSSDQRARIEAAKKVVECQIMYYKLLEKGPTCKSITIPTLKINGTESDRGLESLGENTVST